MMPSWLFSGARPGAALLCANLVVAMPISIVVGNPAFFVFSGVQFLPGVIAAAAVLFAALVGIERLISSRWRPAYGDALIVLAVVLWIEAAFVADKELHWWSERRWQPSQLSGLAAMYAAAVALGWLALNRWAADVRRFTLFLTLGLSAFASVQLARDKATPYRAGPTEEVYAFSGRGDVVVIVLDGLQPDVFEEVLARRPHLRPAFDGFVFFPRATGVASSTHLSMPAIHGGLTYQDGASIAALYDAAVTRGSFMAALSDAGFASILVNPILDACPAGAAWCGHQTTLLDGNAISYLRELGVLLRLAAARSVPTPLSAGIAGIDQFDPGIHDAVGRGAELLERFARFARRVDGAPRAKFLHVLTTHAPIRVDEDCRPSQGAHWMRFDMVRQSECAIRRVADLLARLRQIDVFDNATVMLVSDHGASLPPADPQLRRSRDGWFQAVAGMAAVTLAVKTPGATGALRTSDAPAQLVDVSTTVCRVSRACEVKGAGIDLLAAADAEQRRPREFAYYEWFAGRWARDVMRVPYRFVIDGDRTDVLAWTQIVGEPQPRRVDIAGRPGSGGLGFGWSEVHTDDGARWTIGPVAQAYVQAVRSARARLRVHLATHAGNDAQRVAVLVNGRQICAAAVAVDVIVRLDCSPAAGATGSVNDKIELLFAQWQPSSAHGGRRLAARVHLIEVEEIP